MILLHPPLSLGKKFYLQRRQIPLLPKSQPGIFDSAPAAVAAGSGAAVFSQNFDDVIVKPSLHFTHSPACMLIQLSIRQRPSSLTLKLLKQVVHLLSTATPQFLSTQMPLLKVSSGRHWRHHLLFSSNFRQTGLLWTQSPFCSL